jgi:hypothetical protein
MIEEFTVGQYPNVTDNPNYHSTTDTLATLNLQLHAKFTGGLVAALASFANP